MVKKVKKLISMILALAVIMFAIFISPKPSTATVVNALTEPSTSSPIYYVKDSTILQTLLKTIPAYSKIEFSKDITNHQYFINTEIIINKPVSIDFNGTQIIQQTSGKGGIKVTSGDVSLANLVLIGYQNALIVPTEIGINCFGVNSGNYLENIIFRNCAVSNFGFSGIKLEFVSNFEVTSCNIHNVALSGVWGNSCKIGDISGNIIKDIKETKGNAYGITLSRKENNSLVVSPRSTDIVVSKNRVENVLVWEGLDTHGGENISFIDNTLINCKVGIAAVGSDNGRQAQTFAPINCTIASNTITSNVENGTNGAGIIIAGCNTSIEQATNCIVTSNIIENYGNQTNALSGGIYVRNTENLSISNNTISNPSPSGICMSSNNYAFTITGNSILDAWTNTGLQAIGVLLNTAPQNGVISGNTFKKNTKVAKIVLNKGVRISSASGISVQVGDNYSNVDNYFYEKLNTYQSYNQTTTGRIFKGTLAPTKGTWVVNDFIDNNVKKILGVAGSRYKILGYRCITPGTPGIWHEVIAGGQ